LLNQSLSNLKPQRKYKRKATKNHSRSLSELYTLYKNIVSRRASCTKSSTRTKNGRIVLSKRIDYLIHQNIKKHKEKADQELLNKSKIEEQRKLNKEYLLKRNKVIRIMNGKSKKKPVNENDSGKKYNALVLESPKVISRRAELGLEFLDMQKSIVKGSTERKKNRLKKKTKTIKKDTTPRNTLEIKSYMKRKQKRIKLDLQRKKKEATEKKLTIDKNMSKLQECVRKIFTEPTSVKNVNSPNKLRTQRNYMQHLLPNISKHQNINNELMNSIKVELLNEINPNITEAMIKCNSAERIQKLFRKRLNVRKLNPQQLSNLLQGDPPKEKVTHISSKNTLEELKIEEVLFNSNKSAEERQIAEMRLLVGSEKRLRGSLELEHKEPLGSSLFEKKSFDEFTSKKIKDLLKENHVSSLIELQEQVIKYKEAAEKQYMKRMYQAKEYSLKTYQRKRKELERWVTKEKEEIKKTKNTLMKAWNKTALMVEEVDKSKLQLSRILMRHTMSYNNDINLLMPYDTNRPATDRESLHSEFTDTLTEPNIKKEEVSESNKAFNELSKNNNDLILIQDAEQAITYKKEVEESMLPLFPPREVNTLVENTMESPLVLLEMLASKEHSGIQTDQFYISQYIDDLFIEVCKHHKEHLVSEINHSLIRPPLEMLKILQSSDPNRLLPPTLPHEISPVVPLSVYKVLEKKYMSSSLDNYSRIHNRALFDSVNEALNLIRPYGLNYEPMPWSAQGRILFKSISDQGIIVKNIKNMVLDWSSFEVGTLPSPEFLLEGKFDEEYFAGVRERQLATLLAQEVNIVIK